MTNIEIQPQPKKAFLHLLPSMILMALLGCSYAFYFRNITPCDFIFGIHATYMAMVAFTYGFPIFLLILSIPNMITAYNVFAYGYYPPLNTPTFRAVLAVHGVKAYLRGGLLLLLPLAALVALSFGNNTYQALAQGRSYSDMLVNFTDNCLKDSQ